MKRKHPASAEPTEPSGEPAERIESGINHQTGSDGSNAGTPDSNDETTPRKPENPADSNQDMAGQVPIPLGLAMSDPVPAAATPAPGQSGSQTQSQPGEKMSKPQGAVGSKNVPVPPILLEGDEPKAAASTGPGEKFALANQLEAKPPDPGPVQLPESYNTGRLLLTARDPNCLYAHWDISAEQQSEFNQRSVHHHLVLRVHEESLAGPVIAEQHLKSESRHTFVPVDSATGKYVAQLGYYPLDQPWQALAASETAVSPKLPKANQAPLQFATLTFPIETGSVIRQARSLPGGALLETPLAAEPGPLLPSQVAFSGTPIPNLNSEFPLVRTTSTETNESIGAEPIVSEIESEEEEFVPPSAVAVSQPEIAWTTSQEKALAELIGRSVIRQKRVGSAEIAALMRGDLNWTSILAPEEVSSISAAALSSESLMAGPSAGPPGFWLNVNAELVIYGSTEPNSTVRIAGRAIRLRPDGTFSFRFSLPEGLYELPVEAVSLKGEVRRAELEFHRSSRYSGEVRTHPQDPELGPPNTEKLS